MELDENPITFEVEVLGKTFERKDSLLRNGIAFLDKSYHPH